jgi:hypothetical protein
LKKLSPAPIPNKFPSRVTLLNKLMSTILTTLAMTGVTFVIAEVHKRTNRRSVEIDKKMSKETGVSNITGLTRERGAFNKALNMLAEGAAANPRLLEYHQSVTRRVTSDVVSGKAGSAQSAGDNSQRGSDDVTPPVQMGMLPDQSASLASSDSQTVEEAKRETHNRFTVGDVDFETNPAIEQWTRYYASSSVGRQTMKIGMERSDAYLEMARAEFRQAGVPEDLVWLAFVESVWNPQAVSPASAGGLWQFIPSTAADYGLKVEPGLDERTDPAKQTRVAAAYLRDLYALFGNWELAMAAYNSGEPRVMGAIVKNGKADYWELCDKELLPKETRNYVPKILASILVLSRPQDYGLHEAGF